MKNLIFFLLLSLTPVIGFSNHENRFVFKGKVEGLETGTVSLVYRGMDGEDTTISAVINSGEFTLTGQAPEPELVRLNVQGEWNYSLSFFLENGDISIQLFKDYGGRTEITGSPSNTIYQKLEPQQQGFFD